MNACYYYSNQGPWPQKYDIIYFIEYLKGFEPKEPIIYKELDTGKG